MSRRRKAASTYVEVSDSDDDDDFIKSSAAESAAVKGWGESRLKRQRTARRTDAHFAEVNGGLDKAVDLCDDNDLAVHRKFDDPEKRGTTQVDSKFQHEDSDTVNAREVIVPESSAELGSLGLVPKKKLRKPVLSDDERSDRASDGSFKLDDESDYNVDNSDSEFEIEQAVKRKGAKKKATPAKSIEKSRSGAAKKRSIPKVAVKPRKKLGTTPKSSSSSSGGFSTEQTPGGRPLLKPRLTMMQIPKGDSGSKPRTPLNQGGAPRYRAGLSRNARIPRLHKYFEAE